ncbi:MAG: ATP-binding cassette domain-containing protein [Ilumatobacteraceae bacterium]
MTSQLNGEMTGDIVVRARDVARTFGKGPTAVIAVHGVSCEVHACEQVALTGPSGSGKTTLLHLFAGLDVPTTGDIDWPAIGSIHELRPGPIAVVFQGPSLLPPLDVVENVALPLLLQGTNRATARSEAIVALERLDLMALASKLPEELSGGQAQRVAVARVLAGQPRLILADEPTGQLDHASGALVVDALIEAATTLGAALIVNTHDRAISDRFDIHWSMAGGRLTEKAPTPC